MQTARGLVPSIAFLPKVGMAMASVLVELKPIISSSPAILE